MSDLKSRLRKAGTGPDGAFYLGEVGSLTNEAADALDEAEKVIDRLAVIPELVLIMATIETPRELIDAAGRAQAAYKAWKEGNNG